jgi:hypothetical protein
MIGQNAVLQVGYVGNRGEHMPLGGYNLDINQIPDKYDGLPASQLSQSFRPPRPIISRPVERFW